LTNAPVLNEMDYGSTIPHVSKCMLIDDFILESGSLE
jgi:hypothetical protein